MEPSIKLFLSRATNEEKARFQTAWGSIEPEVRMKAAEMVLFKLEPAELKAAGIVTGGRNDGDWSVASYSDNDRRSATVISEVLTKNNITFYIDCDLGFCALLVPKAQFVKAQFLAEKLVTEGQAQLDIFGPELHF